MKTATAIVIGVVICSASAARSPVWAQPASAPGATAAPATSGGDDKPWNRGVPVATREAARALFLEANRLFAIPLYTRAADKYAAALGKWKHPAFYFNLALAQLNLGQEVEAHDSLRRAVQHGQEPLGERPFREAESQLRELEHQLGRIRVQCPTDGAEVTLDGATLFTAPGSHEVWVKPAAHQITARRAEYVTLARRVDVAPGKLEQLDLRMHKLIEDRPWAIWKPWAVVGTGVAVAAAGGVLHALSAGNFTKYDDRFRQLSCAGAGCTDDQVRAMDPHLPAVLDRAQLQQRLAIAGYIAGGAIIATGAVLLYLNRPHVVEQGGPSSPAPGVAVTPVASADAFGVVVTVSH